MKLPLLSGRQVLAALQRLGFIELHRRGSQVKMEYPDGRRMVFPLRDEVDRWPTLAAEANVCVHLYGKREARDGRKMGHITRLLANPKVKRDLGEN